MQAVSFSIDAAAYSSGMVTPDHRLGEYIRTQRKARNWSQDDLAGNVGVRGLAVGKWERGQATPTTENRIRLAEVFGVDAAELGVTVPVQAPASAVDLSPVLDAIAVQSNAISGMTALAEDIPGIRAELELLRRDMAFVRKYIEDRSMTEERA